jgi:hypothetical protein
MTDEILGWKPPVIYDMGADQTRIATQEDIDRLVKQVAVLGQFFRDMQTQSRLVRTSLGVPDNA